MNKENLKKLLESAYNLISTLPVSGDAVERLAAARHQLRAAWKELEAPTPEPEQEGRNGDR